MNGGTQRPVVEYSLNRGESKDLIIVAEEFYFAEKIVVKENQQYLITIAKGQTCKDWFINADPLKGFFNVPGVIVGMRVRGAKGFTLCAAFNDNDEGAFRVEVDKPLPIEREGAKTLSFFANDCVGFYSNNFGSIKVKIKRLQ